MTEPLNIFERLGSLSRSPEQDRTVRRLVDGGFPITTLDTARPVGPIHLTERRLISDDGPFSVIVLRDARGARWTVDTRGRLMPAGRTQWQVTSP